MITLDNLKINSKLVKVFSISSLAIAISACSQTNPAKIENLSEPSYSSTNASSAAVIDRSSPSTYSAPPANITTARQISSAPANKSYSSTVQSDGNVVTTTQELMTYNRNYEDIPKGGYKGDTYTVKRGDTLFYIAWITGNDFRSLAAKNNIKAPYELNVNQVIDVSGGTTVVVTKQTTTKAGTTKPAETKTTTTTTTTSNQARPTTTVTTTTATGAAAAISNGPSAKVANITWQWPVKGKLIETFSNATKGIDISGSLGDKITASADGKVVYAGNALPGYGNLIIIKHNDDYLTAYAHNQSILVKEQQDVKAGQQIATMGNTGTNSVRLHFEIRYQAKSVDPLKYLPKQ
ncbi:peptidoglycan DD-metalloendopeptidase family protein [Orbus wheelerorum]|uniref:peptidoglycan DD-metalloendopeptidase family protein n=1 Tax=Orbus wheelerorum TaxID=3074111 RepID=UPI00370D2D36